MLLHSHSFSCIHLITFISGGHLLRQPSPEQHDLQQLFSFILIHSFSFIHSNSFIKNIHFRLPPLALILSRTTWSSTTAFISFLSFIGIHFHAFLCILIHLHSFQVATSCANPLQNYMIFNNSDSFILIHSFSFIHLHSLQVATSCANPLQNYMIFNNSDGIYTYAYEAVRNEECLACSQSAKNITLSRLV